MDQARRLEQARLFFRTLGRERTWDRLLSEMTERGLTVRVVAIGSLMQGGRPGEIRLVTIPHGEQRATRVHAILIPSLRGPSVLLQTRLPLEHLPDALKAEAEAFVRGSMRSRLTLPYGRLLEVVRLLL
jgi:hypothetical protein